MQLIEHQTPSRAHVILRADLGVEGSSGEVERFQVYFGSPLVTVLAGQPAVVEAVQAIARGERAFADFTVRAEGTGSAPSTYLRSVCLSLSPAPGWRGRVLLSVSDPARDSDTAEKYISSLDYYATLMREASDGIAIADPSGAYIDANPAALRLLGYSLGELRRLSVRTIVHPDDLPRIAAARTGFQRGSPIVVENRMRRRDGSWLLAEVSGFVLADGRLVGIFRDIGARREAEVRVHQAQALEVVGQLAGGISHSFNNLLTVVLGQAELIQRHVGLAGLSEEVSPILDAVRQGTRVTEQLAVLSPGQVLAWCVVSLPDLCDMTRDAVSLALTDPDGLLLETDGRPGSVRIDPACYRQAVTNLALNAHEAMRDGAPLRIRLAVADHVAGNAYGNVVIAIHDTGIGMDSATLQRATQPFFTTKERSSGVVGLGLPVAYGIMKRFGGDLSIESEPHQGTTVRMTIPLFPEPEAPAPSPSERPAPGGELVLLVEDDAQIRRLVGLMLESRGYRVCSAPDGTEALEVAARAGTPIGLLLTDVIMPRLGGRELAERLSERQPELRVLFMSGHADDVRMVSEIGSPFWGYIQKPFRMEVMLSAVRSLIDQPSRLRPPPGGTAP